MDVKHIVLVNGSHLLNGMLYRVISRTQDLKVIAKISDPSNLPNAIENNQVDWIVLNQPSAGNLPREIDSLIEKNPAIHVLTIALDTGIVHINWINHNKKRMELTTVEELAHVLRVEPVV